MPHVTMRFTDDEKSTIETYAKFIGLNITEAIKNIIFEKLEDEYDLKTIKEYEKEKEAGNITYYSIDEARKELGI